MKMVYIFLLIMLSSKVFAQCKSGNCQNGTGIYDFGWCVYSGEFKYGKPDGTGKMKYSDYTYEGQFKNGLEDGKGVIIYQNKTRENVVYVAGKKTVYVTEKITEKEYNKLTEQKTGCIDGDCSTGFGTVAFANGNKYVGNFVNKKRQGAGTFYFSNGDVFEGRFDNDRISHGTYNFSNGYSFTGTWDLSGNMQTGTYRAPAGNTVELVNGKVILPKVPVMANNATGNSGYDCSEKVTCPLCKGRPYKVERINQNTSSYIGGTYSMIVTAAGIRNMKVRRLTAQRVFQT